MKMQKLLSLVLASMLAVNCCMPCYTLAYADELQEVASEWVSAHQQERPGDGKACQWPDLSGVLRDEAAEEAPSRAQCSAASAPAGFTPSAAFLVEGSYSLADTLIRGFAGKAYADNAQEVPDVVQEEATHSRDAGADGEPAADGHASDDAASEGLGAATSGNNGDISSYLSDIVLLLGELVDYYRSSSSGIETYATFETQNLSYLSLIESHTDLTSVRLLYSGALNGRASGTYPVSLLLALCYNRLYDIQQQFTALNSSMKTTHTFPGESSATTETSANILWRLTRLLYDDSSKMSIPQYLSRISDLTSKQWGSGYGGTAVIYDNSPASWLKNLSINSVTTHTFPGESKTTTEGSANILWRITRLLWDDTNKQSVISSLVGSNGILQTIRDRQVTTHTFPGESMASTEGSANILWRLTRLLWDDGNKVSAVQAILKNNDLLAKQWGTGYGGTVVTYANSPASLLKSIATNSVTTHTFPGESSMTTEGSANILWRITRLLWDDTNKQSVISSLVGSNGILQTIRDRQVTTHTFPGETEATTEGSANILWRITRLLWDDSESASLVDYSRNIRDLLKDLVHSGVSVDMSETNKLLGLLAADVEGLRRMFAVQGAKDIIDAIVGDFGNIVSPALVSEVQAAASTAFPFCVPAVVKQVLGLVQAEPVPPSFDFEIGGEVMHVDASGMQGFAEIVGWACRLLLVFGLAVSSRRFIYSPGGAQS